eukprot:COSAG02_NODE_987_length_15443_cov_8.132625_14_plen_877_part_00
MRQLLCLGLAAVLGSVAGAEEECGDVAIEQPAIPQALEGYRQNMETFGTDEASEGEKNARLARESTRAVPRTATDEAGNTFSVSDRFCALEYPDECPATWPSGSPKPDGLECAGVETTGGECDSNNMAKYIGIPVVDETVGALTVTMTLPITIAIVFMIIFFLWYFLRCCKLCGGRKASTECIRCANYYDPEDKGGGGYTGAGGEQAAASAEAPSYAVGEGCQTALFRFWFLVFFILVSAALAIGFVANETVDTGLTNTVDILFYNVQNMAYEVSETLNDLNDVMEGSDLGLDPNALAEQQAQLSCLSQELTELENDIADSKDLGLDVRSYYVTAMLVIPFLVGLVYAVSAWCKWKYFVGFGSLLGWLLLIFVCISAAIHSLLALLLADVCYEFDLHLATYFLDTSDLYNTTENLAWLPEDAKGFCGEDGQLAFIQQEFQAQFDVAIQQGVDGIATVCNDPDLQGFMDCEDVDILAGSAGSYVGKTVACTEGQDEATCGASYYNGLLGNVPDQLMITDVDLAAVEVTSLTALPPEVKNCLANIQSRPWPSTGWSGLDVCMGADGAPTDDLTEADCTTDSGVWLKLTLAADNEACTENGVTVEGHCAQPSGLPTGAAVEAGCGVCTDTVQLTQADCTAASGVWTPYTWTSLELTGTTDMSTITTHLTDCITAASTVYVGREYGPSFTDSACSSPGDPTSCDVPAAIENSYTFPFDADEQAALDTWGATPPDEEAVKNCYIDINTDQPCEQDPCLPPFFPRKTFRECASSCAQEEAKDNADEAVTQIDTATTLFARIYEIYLSDALPKLQCRFVSEIVADIFVPLCEESYGGIFLITLANYMGTVGLILSIPLGIMATKRFKDWEDESEEVGKKTFSM